MPPVFLKQYYGRPKCALRNLSACLPGVSKTRYPTEKNFTHKTSKFKIEAKVGWHSSSSNEIAKVLRNAGNGVVC